MNDGRLMRPAEGRRARGAPLSFLPGVCAGLIRARNFRPRELTRPGFVLLLPPEPVRVGSRDGERVARGGPRTGSACLGGRAPDLLPGGVITLFYATLPASGKVGNAPLRA